MKSFLRRISLPGTIFLAFLFCSAVIYQAIRHDATLLGDGITGSLLRADTTTWVATKYNVARVLGDGDRGDIVISGGSLTWDVDAGAIGATELASTAVSAASYFGGGFTVDADGRLTAAWNPRTISPSQITSDQDNYNPTGFGNAEIIRLSSDNGMRAITSMVDSTGGVHRKTIVNSGSYLIYFPMDHPDGTAANRFTGQPGDYYLYPGRSADFWYDPTSSRWRVINGNSGYLEPTIYYSFSARNSTAGDQADIAHAAIGTGTISTLASTSLLPACWQFSTSTNAAWGYLAYFTETVTTYSAFGLAHQFAEAVVSIPVLSTAGETFTAELQLIATPTTASLEANNTIGIRYSHGIAGGDWELFCQDNAGSEGTPDDLDVAVAAATLYKLRIEVDKSNSEARAYINGSYVGRVTNMPLGSVMGARVVLLKSNGTTARTLNLHAFNAGAIHLY